jgi:uncharacterized phage-associated protein
MKMSPSIVANFFLKKGKQEDIPISVMKLLKLAYIAHGWALALLDNEEGFFGTETVEAWRHGPVIPSLYHEFKHYQNSPIQDWSQTTIGESDRGFELKPIFIETSDILEKEKAIEILYTVWESYKEYSGWGLSLKTHEAGSPWSQIYREGEKGLVIPNPLIKGYYKDYLNKVVGYG